MKDTYHDLVLEWHEVLLEAESSDKENIKKAIEIARKQKNILERMTDSISDFVSKLDKKKHPDIPIKEYPKRCSNYYKRKKVSYNISYVFDKDDIDTNRELYTKYSNQLKKYLSTRNQDDFRTLTKIIHELEEHVLYGRTMSRKRKQNLNQAIKTIEWYLTSKYYEQIKVIEKRIDDLSIEITELYRRNSQKGIIYLYERLWLIINNELVMQRHNLKQVELIIYNARLD